MSTFSRREFITTTLAAGAVYPHLAHGQTGKQRPICVFSKHLQWCKSFEEMAEVAAEIGFDGVDLTVRNGGHVSPQEAVEKLPVAVGAVRKAGLDVYMMTTGINDPDDRNTEPILTTASDLGIGFYRMGYLSYDEKLGVAKSLDNLRHRVARLAELNEKYNIHGAYQNHSGIRVGGPVWDIWELVKDLDPRWIGCQYDIRHATVEGGTSWPLGLDLLQKHIKITAIKDFVWGKNDGEWRTVNVPLGEGMVDFAAYFKSVAKYRIAGPISMHFEYPLGGANDGETEITISASELKKAMKSDLKLLRKWLAEANL